VRQLSLFDTVEGFRHQCLLTDQCDDNIASLERRHRRRTRAENVIRLTPTGRRLDLDAPDPWTGAILAAIHPNPRRRPVPWVGVALLDAPTALVRPVPPER
jgi:hypothetical protein